MGCGGCNRCAATAIGVSRAQRVWLWRGRRVAYLAAMQQPQKRALGQPAKTSGRVPNESGTPARTVDRWRTVSFVRRGCKRQQPAQAGEYATCRSLPRWVRRAAGRPPGRTVLTGAPLPEESLAASGLDARGRLVVFEAIVPVRRPMGQIAGSGMHAHVVCLGRKRGVPFCGLFDRFWGRAVRGEGMAARRCGHRGGSSTSLLRSRRRHSSGAAQRKPGGRWRGLGYVAKEENEDVFPAFSVCWQGYRRRNPGATRTTRRPKGSSWPGGANRRRRCPPYNWLAPRGALARGGKLAGGTVIGDPPGGLTGTTGAGPAAEKPRHRDAAPRLAGVARARWTARRALYPRARGLGVPGSRMRPVAPAGGKLIRPCSRENRCGPTPHCFRLVPVQPAGLAQRGARRGGRAHDSSGRLGEVLSDFSFFGRRKEAFSMGYQKEVFLVAWAEEK